MQIQIHCAKCNKTEHINNEVEVLKKASSLPGIPIPKSNGLTTYSIVHDDHTLILDIDAHGNVRGEQIIDRIDDKMERILAAISIKIMQNYVIERDLSMEPTFIFITQNKMLQNLLLGAFQHLIFNLPRGVESLLSVRSDESLLEYGNVTIYVGDWSEKIYNFASSQTMIIYELFEHNANLIPTFLQTDCESAKIDDFVILFNSEFIETPLGKEAISKLFSINSNLQALDMSNPEKAAKSLFTILNHFV